MTWEQSNEPYRRYFCSDVRGERLVLKIGPPRFKHEASVSERAEQGLVAHFHHANGNERVMKAFCGGLPLVLPRAASRWSSSHATLETPRHFCTATAATGRPRENR